jgi:hypothetical protein
VSGEAADTGFPSRLNLIKGARPNFDVFATFNHWKADPPGVLPADFAKSRISLTGRLLPFLPRTSASFEAVAIRFSLLRLNSERHLHPDFGESVLTSGH